MKIKIFTKWWLLVIAFVIITAMGAYTVNIRITGSFCLNIRGPVEGIRIDCSAITPVGRSISLLSGSTYKGNFRNILFGCHSSMLPVLQATVFTLETENNRYQFTGRELKEYKKNGSDYLQFALPQK